MSAAVWIVVIARAWPPRAARARRWSPLAGRPLLEVLLDRHAAARAAWTGVALATSVRPENDVLAQVAARLGVPAFRGDEDDVLRRHLDCARALRRGPRRARDRRQPADRRRDAGAAGGTCTSREGADYTYVPGDALLMGILSRGDLHRGPGAGVGARRRPPPLGAGDALHQGAPGRSSASPPRSCPRACYRPAYRLTVDEPEDVRADAGAVRSPGPAGPRGDAPARRSRCSTPSRRWPPSTRTCGTRPPTCARWRWTRHIVRAGPR